MESALKTKNMHQGLKENFLYKSDINSISILLAMYDIEENISNIYPKYMCLKEIKQKIISILKKRTDGENIAHNLSVTIHEDINRLELCFYLEGYRDGCNNLRFTNKLEKKIVEEYGINYLYRDKFFNQYINDQKLAEIKEEFFQEISENIIKRVYTKQLIDRFMTKVIKNKIINLEKYVDKQLKFGFNVNNFIIEEIDYSVSYEDLKKIIITIRESLTKHLNETYTEAFWNALSDNVFRRYK